jgi:hypothetical protein
VLKVFPAVLLGLTLTISGCITAETRKQLEQAGADVAMLTLKVEKAEKAHSADLEDLRQQLLDARVKLLAVEAKATAEREKPIGDVASGVETAATAAQPIVAAVFPAALPILALIGGIAALIKKKFQPSEVK